MKAERFEALAQRLLDDELSPEESAELSVALGAEPEYRHELRRLLGLWELWAQRQAPERSAEAFVAGWQTRLRAENQGERFVAEVEQRIRQDRADGRDHVNGSAPAGVFHWWRALQQPTGVLWTAVSTLMIAGVLWLAMPHRAEANVTVHGEAICTACTLHETHAHLPAIRVREGETTRIYYVRANQVAIMRLGDYCTAPVPLVATGRSETRDDRLMFDAYDAQAVPPAPRQREPILFPF